MSWLWDLAFVDMIDFFADDDLVNNLFLPFLLSVHIREPKMLFNLKNVGRSSKIVIIMTLSARGFHYG